MINKIMVLALAVALTACSSDSNETPPADTTAGNTTNGGTTNGTTTNGDTTSGTTDTGNTDGGSTVVTPSGGLPGVWFGQNNYGETVMVIDQNQNVFSFALDVISSADDADGIINRQSVIGPASGQLEVFTHRDSNNLSNNSSFTLVGELDSTVSYNLAVENDGQQITNSSTGTVGDYTLTLANLFDVPAISVADVAGTWTAETSFCAVGCDLDLTMTIDASGSVSGDVNFDNGTDVFITPIDAGSNVAAAAGSNQYLSVLINWNGTTRQGVLYWHRNDQTQLFLNSFGLDGEANVSWAATLTR